MIKTTRSRLEIRQEPDRKSSLGGSLLVAVGATEALLALASLVAEWALPVGRGYAGAAARLLISAAAVGAGWFLLRRRSRVILDLDHRMVARYRGLIGPVSGGNRSWDLTEFETVVHAAWTDRGFFDCFGGRGDRVSLRRADGTELEIYRAADPQDADETCVRVASFLGLPRVGPGQPG